MKKTFTILSLLFSFFGFAQNTCSTAIAITPGTYTTGIIDGTNFDEGCWHNTGTEGDHAEWYAYTPAADGIARINTNFAVNDGVTLSNYMQVSVYEGACTALNCHVAYGPIGSPAPFKPNFTFEVRTGKTYYIAFDDQASNKGLQFELTLQTPTCNTILPYTEAWPTHLGFTCWETFNTDNEQKWVYYPVANLNEDPAKDPVAAAFPSTTNTAQAKNDWLISPPLQLQVGTNYTISIKYNALHSGAGMANETLRTFMLTGPSPASPLPTQLGQITGITQEGAYTEPYNMDLATTVNYNFAPNATGEYHVGLHAASPAATGILVIYEVKVVQGTLGNPDFALDNISVYPNPATNSITIDAGAGITIHSVSVVDVNGRTVIDKRNISNALQIDLGTIAQGMYLVKIVTDKGSVVKRIIKQ